MRTSQSLSRRGLARRLGRLAAAGPALGAVWATACGASESGGDAPAPAAAPVPLEFQFYLPVTHPAGGV